MNEFVSVWKNSFNFSGRARRKEYWMYMLFTIIAVFVLSLIGGMVFGDSPALASSLYGVFMLVSLVPSLAVSIRRLHDTSRSGWWLLINFVPLIGGIWFFVLTVLDSKPETNSWGPSPKYDGVSVV